MKNNQYSTIKKKTDTFPKTNSKRYLSNETIIIIFARLLIGTKNKKTQTELS